MSPGIGIKYKNILLYGSKNMEQNSTAETAPEAPTELYKALSLYLRNVVKEEITMADKYMKVYQKFE